LDFTSIVSIPPSHFNGKSAPKINLSQEKVKKKKIKRNYDKITTHTPAVGWTSRAIDFARHHLV